MERKPNMVSSIHLKGGCGKTTVLTDLAIYNAHLGKKVCAIDTDRQGSLYTTLTEQAVQHHLPDKRFQYAEDIASGKSLRPSQTKYTDINNNLVVAHYPIEMTYDDSFTITDTTTTAIERLRQATREADLVLIDTRPANLVENEVALFRMLTTDVNQYYFLVPSRPNEKEIDDGLFCYDAVIQLLAAQGLDLRRISPISITNMANISGLDFMGDATQIGDSRFFERIAGGIELPSVPRSGYDLTHYSIFLDHDIDLDALIKLSKVKTGIGTDWMIDAAMQYGDPLDAFQAEGVRSRLKPHIAYLAGIQTLTRIVDPRS